ncbi:MAG: hypothetical protein ACKPKO_06155, partial [Candidatus Fonsibacter sp.]
KSNGTKTLTNNDKYICPTQAKTELVKNNVIEPSITNITTDTERNILTTFNNSLEKNIELNIHKIRNHRDNNKKGRMKSLIAQAF